MRPGDRGATSTKVPRPVIALVHIQKTAGTSLKFILKNSFGLSHCDVNAIDPSVGAPFGEKDLDFVLGFCPNLRSISGHEVIEPTSNLGNRVLPYTLLREPIRRSISHFQDKNVRGARSVTLDEFLLDEANHDLQVRKIAGEPNLQKAIDLLEERFLFVGLTERFNLSLKVFEALCPYRLNLRQKSQHVALDNRIRDRIASSPEQVDRFASVNRLDTELYSFVDQVLFPRMVARAGLSNRDYEQAASPSDWPAPKYIANRLFHKLVYRTFLKHERRKRSRLRHDSRLSTSDHE
ncbi:MAG: hypothetical protein ACR2QU_01230 [Gammaproteobacteria bacterium]